MLVEISAEPEVITARPYGSLTVVEGPALYLAVAPVMDQRPPPDKLVLDLRGIATIDDDGSDSLAILVSFLRRSGIDVEILDAHGRRLLKRRCSNRRS